MKACKDYDNKTGKCAKDTAAPCPVDGDEDKCPISDKPVSDFIEELKKGAREAVEETHEFKDEEKKDPTIEIVKRVLELVKEDEPLRDAVVRLIDAQTKRMLAEATWRNALALGHMRKSDTKKPVGKKE